MSHPRHLKPRDPQSDLYRTWLAILAILLTGALLQTLIGPAATVIAAVLCYLPLHRFRAVLAPVPTRSTSRKSHQLATAVR